MSTCKRYPLDPLLQQREERVDESARQLHERADEKRRAELTHERAERERLDHENETERLTYQEVRRVDKVGASSEDLRRLHAWRLAQAMQAEALQAREQAACEQRRKAQKLEDEARKSLADVRAEAKVIEKHRDRFIERERKAEQTRLEEEVEDTVYARWGRRHD